MASDGVPRRHFFYGALLAGAVPAGGYGGTPSLKALGYKSPNEKLNIAGIGAGGQPFSDLRDSEAGVENIVALADVDWERGKQGFTTWPKAEKYKDFRKMLDQQGKNIDAVVIGTPDHMHATCALACMQMGKHIYVEKPLTRTAWEARVLAEAAEKYKVATQMGNQGYSHDATRVACEIFWSGEIGEVRQVHAWHGRPGWPRGMPKIPAPTPVPETLDWDLWLGGAAMRPFTAGDDDYTTFAAEFMAAGRAGRGAAGGAGAAPPAGAEAAQAAASRGGGGSQFGFYLPFNWRGFYDFGSSLFGDWGVHILGPANWALQLSPRHLISVEAIEKEGTGPFTYPVKRRQVRVRRARQSASGDGLLERQRSRRRLSAARDDHGAGAQSRRRGPAGRSGRTRRTRRRPGCASRTTGWTRRWAAGQRLQLHLRRFQGLSGDQRTRRRRRLASRFEVGGIQTAQRLLAALSGSQHGRQSFGALPRLGARLQRRRAGLLQLQHRRPVHRMAGAGRRGHSLRRQDVWDANKMEFTNNKDATRWIKPTFRKGWEVK